MEEELPREEELLSEALVKEELLSDDAVLSEALIEEEILSDEVLLSVDKEAEGRLNEVEDVVSIALVVLKSELEVVRLIVVDELRSGIKALEIEMTVEMGNDVEDKKELSELAVMVETVEDVDKSEEELDRFEPNVSVALGEAGGEEVEEDSNDENEDDTAQPTGLSAKMVLLLSVRDPPSANKPPSLEACPFAVIETWARMVPAKLVPVPRVALVPTFQKTLPGSPPPVRITADPTAVTKVVPI
jgi:hypothetical protein